MNQVNKITDSLFKEYCYDLNEDGSARGVDVRGILEGLILYDRLIINSVRFIELSALLKTFGFQGLLHLIESGALALSFDAISTAQTGQSALEGYKILPKGCYRFDAIQITDPIAYRKECISKAISRITGLTQNERDTLASIIDRRTLTHPKGSIEEIVSSLNNDLRSQDPSLKIAISEFLLTKLGVILPSEKIKIVVDPLAENEFRIGTNLHQLMKIEEDEIIEAVEQGSLALAGRNQKIAEMRNFNTLVGIRDDEVPILEENFSFLERQLNREGERQTLQRVLAISNFPEFNYEDSLTIDVTKLLDIRYSVECREFRKWLSNCVNASDKEIADQIFSLRSKLGNMIGSTTGKVIRFLANTGIGVFSTPLSVIIGALDSFLLEKIFPLNAPIVFLQQDLRSIFKKEDKTP